MAFFKALGEMFVNGFVCNSYDENNNRIGHTKGTGDDYIIHDQYGNRVGHVKKDLNGNIVEYDKYGNRKGYYGR